MWLEEFAWLWLSVAGGCGLMLIWSHIALRAAVRAIRERVERLEAGASPSRQNALYTSAE